MARQIDWEILAAHGHAPAVGCSLLGVGYEDAFDGLISRYIDDRFSRGLSAQKLVVGPYGSGKTHFLRQLMEMAAQRGVVTAEVKLNKDIDFTKRLILYREIASVLQAPGQPDHGIAGFMRASLERVRQSFPEQARDVAAAAWVNGIASTDLRLDAFTRVVQVAYRALLQDDEGDFLAATRWLEGEISDTALAKSLPVSKIAPADQNRIAGQMLQSLLQLARHARYTGTVIGIDEAEQGFAVDRRKLDRILSMIKSDLDSVADLEGGSALVLYAITPNIREEMDLLPPLAARIADPGGKGFLDGNYLAPVINLTYRSDPTELLVRISQRLVQVFATDHALPHGLDLAGALDRAEDIARSVAAEDQSSSSRRTCVRAVVAFLLGVPFGVDDDLGPEF